MNRFVNLSNRQLKTLNAILCIIFTVFLLWATGTIYRMVYLALHSPGVLLFATIVGVLGVLLCAYWSRIKAFLSKKYRRPVE